MAYVGLADYYAVSPDYEPFRRAETAPKAIAAARKALAIDDTLAEAHTAAASASEDLWDWAGAEREYKRALELNPNEGNAHHWYGLILFAVGRREEALAQFKRALENDPLNLTFNTNLAVSYGNMRRYDLALDQFKKTIDIDPNYASAHSNLSDTYRTWVSMTCGSKNGRRQPHLPTTRKTLSWRMRQLVLMRKAASM